MAFTMITVTRSYKTADGRPAAGTVRFTPSNPMVNGPTVISAPVTGTLDRAGLLSIPVAANNDPATTPTGSYYAVTETLVGQAARSYNVTVPYTAAGGTVDLSTLTTITAPGGGGGGGGTVTLPATLLNRVVAVNGVYPTRPSTGFTDFLGVADPSSVMQTGDTWTQLPATVPNAPTIGTATGGNAQASVAFTAPTWNGGATITGYTATSSPGNITGTGSSSPITVTGLSNGTAYTFTVKATNSVGTSSASAASNSVTPSTGVTVPGAPTIGTATAGDASATVAFTPPGSNGGATITGYTATSTPGSLTGTGSSSPITVSGLSNGTAYTFKVAATNSAGTGPQSAASNSVTPASSGGGTGAVRFDAVTDVLTRTETGPNPATTGFTVTFWAYQSVDLNDYSAAFRYGDVPGGTTTASIETDVDGSTLLVFTPAGGLGSGVSLTPATWYRVAYTIATDGTGVLYLATAAGTVGVTTVAPVTTTQRGVITIGGRADNTAAEWWNGRIAHVRVWSAALTQSEIVTEWASTTAVKTSGLWASWPLTSAATLTDASGNNRTLTAGSTAVTTEAGPPIP